MRSQLAPNVAASRSRTELLTAWSSALRANADLCELRQVMSCHVVGGEPDRSSNPPRYGAGISTGLPSFGLQLVGVSESPALESTTRLLSNAAIAFAPTGGLKAFAFRPIPTQPAVDGQLNGPTTAAATVLN
jgi:hypothetical protein